MYPSALPHLPGREDNLAGKQNYIQISLVSLWCLMPISTIIQLHVRP
jgi:hypothetical protein